MRLATVPIGESADAGGPISDVGEPAAPGNDDQEGPDFLSRGDPGHTHTPEDVGPARPGISGTPARPCTAGSFVTTGIASRASRSAAPGRPVGGGRPGPSPSSPQSAGSERATRAGARTSWPSSCGARDPTLRLRTRRDNVAPAARGRAVSCDPGTPVTASPGGHSDRQFETCSRYPLEG